MDNIFAPYPIVMPSKYQDKIKTYSETGTQNQSRENSPFNRQIDFWFMALCLAFNKNITPVPEKDTYAPITGEILSRNPHRIAQMQMIAIAEKGTVDVLNNPKDILDCCVELANAGIPYLLSLLDDTDATPLQNIFDELENIDKKQSKEK
jgi:hypothetical protein